MNTENKKNPKHCIIGIVTYKRETFLRKALASAKAVLPENSDIHVFDNSPSTESKKIAAEYPDVIWTFSETNVGYIVARQAWLNDPKYKYYVSIDDDSWFMQGDELSAALDILDRDDTTSVIAFDILTPDRPEEVRRGSEPVQVSSFIGCGHVMRSADARAAGGYVQSIGHYGSEEKDLSIRLLDRGKSVILLPGFHVWHDKSEQGRDIFLQYRSEVCNDLSFALRRTPLALLFPVIIRKLFMHIVFAMRIGRLKALRSGLALLISSLRTVLRYRSAVKYSTLREYKQLQSK